MPSRRTFLTTLGSACLTAPFIARSLRAAAPSRVLRHASFGGGGQAWNDIQALTSNPWVKLVAVADVDLSRIGQLRETFPEVRIYQDWRQLLEKEERNIDSVNVSVPDHMHAPIAFSAMQLGKHCYCQKPLAHDIYETRALTKCAKEKKLVTQMGIQIHSHKIYRQAVALVRSGVIGKVKEVHSWSFKKWGDVGAPPTKSDPVPGSLNWDLWLGTAAARPYVAEEYYHPGNWRKRLDFGTGTFGDMGCHILDPVFEALALTAPISLRSEGPAPDRWNWATDAIVRYIFPGTKHTASNTVPVTWYDGDARPSAEIRALVIPDGTEPGPPKSPDTVDQGSIFIGTEGVLHLPHPAAPRLFPEKKFKGYPMPQAEQGHHWTIWAEACVNGGQPGANFDYSGPLTEAVLLGSVAVRFPQTTLKWNSANLLFTNENSANRYLRRQYRNDWGVDGL
ncbi:MAG: gfo/Idh/MocA family oxidoreductase [Opitutus sp.]|nr:gfo/Idh/MocA family oxidoreductase [Opitutus sp.]